MPLDHNNSRVTRRRVLATAAATPALATPAIAQGVLKGTKLTVLAGQWYVPQTNTMLDELAAELGRDTGMEIRIERFAGDELMTKTAAVVGAGRGADLAVGVEFDTYVYAAKLNDVTDLADEIGRTYGGWLDSAKAASVVGGRWKSLPIGQAPAAWNWRTDMFRAAGLTKFPDTFADLLAADEIERYKTHHDPIRLWKKRLLEEGVTTDAAMDAMDNEIKLEANASAEFALASENPSPESIFEDVYWEVDNNTEAGNTGRHFFGD